MSRLELGFRFGLGLGLLALAGCEKHPPSAQTPVGQPSEQPDTREGTPETAAPAVIIEQPGAAPAPAAPEPEPTLETEGSSFGRMKIVATQIPCQRDADCVESSCCHATSCVAAADAPDCSNATCTADCRSGTVDCEGGCLCDGGRCAAKLWWAPGG